MPRGGRGGGGPRWRGHSRGGGWHGGHSKGGGWHGGYKPWYGRSWYTNVGTDLTLIQWLTLASTLETEAYASSDPILQEELITDAVRIRAWVANVNVA